MEELVGVAERDRARLRQAHQEIGDVGAGGRSGEREAASWVLLREDGQRHAADAAAEGEAVPPAVAKDFDGSAVRPAVVARVVAGRERRQTARERQRRRAPVGRVLVVPGDAGLTRDVHQVGEVRRHVGREIGEFVARAHEHELRQAIGPDQRRVGIGHCGLVHEVEQVGGVGRDALIGHRSHELLAGVDHLGQPSLQAVLLRRDDDGHLVIEAVA